MKPLRVVITGSESTGKTTLAAELAEHYGTVWCPEFSRQYALCKNNLDASDVEAIASGQIASEDAHASRGKRVIIQDTDLVSTVVYARHYYETCPRWIADASKTRRADLYLLMDIDVPWIPDPARDRGHMRKEMHLLFVTALVELRSPFVVISGNWEERRKRAVKAIDEALKRYATK